MWNRFPDIRQMDTMDCGPACLAIVARHYGREVAISRIRELCGITQEGVSMLGLGEAAEALGMTTLCARITVDQLADEILLPCILHWDQHHFVVCYKVTGRGQKRKFHIADPATGHAVYDIKGIYEHWVSCDYMGQDAGLAMQIEPDTHFAQAATEGHKGTESVSFRFFLRYILPHKWRLAQLLLGAMVVMMLGYISPFVSQAMVDLGILGRDLHFILLMMMVQLVIALSQSSITFVQSWLSLHMNTTINIRLVADYLGKLSRMPINFFETRTLGDILQRIGDHSRIKNFLMNDLVSLVFSVGTFITFSAVLAVYKWQILVIFLTGNALNIAWIVGFMKYRRELDNKTFKQSSALQNNMVQFVEGMQEIKLNGIERQKCWQWMHLQAKLYHLSRRSLKLGQLQSAGSMLFSSVTGIFISYITARMVVSGQMTMGMMMSLSFIIGQVSGPISSFIGFALDYQDAKISLERLGDLHLQDDEMQHEQERQHELPAEADIRLHNVTFSYSGKERHNVLHDISIRIPHGQVTAIVGPSGCGKTTLLKLLQRFYEPTQGTITLDDMPFDDIRLRTWRSSVGSVMQDGYLFSDTIAHNISVYDDKTDTQRVREALQTVNMLQHVEGLPNGLNTKIGNEGIGMSQGQKQRILMARMLYKNPGFVFLDEATNALDAKNETEIVGKLQQFFQGKTVVVAAHRLSTIRNAHNIIVMNEGRVAEQGTHTELLGRQGFYYQLVKAQLDSDIA